MDRGTISNDEADALAAYVRELQRRDDALGDWLADALYQFSQDERFKERERLRVEGEPLASAVALRVAASLRVLRGGVPTKDPVDRNLVTVSEFAALVDVAESTVFEWLKLGLPSRKLGGIRRILRREAEGFLIAGGLTRSRAAKKLTRGGRADGR